MSDDPMHALVLAYGNPMRGDDGVAWVIANLLGPIMPEPVRVECVQQLSPEHADSVRENDLVIFIDAAKGGVAGEISYMPVTAQAEPTRFWHHIGPAEILALAKQLYAATPQAVLFTVQAEQFNVGSTLSDKVKSAIPQAVAEICALLKRNGITSARALA